MKIAITADLHLHSKHPERRDALEDILQQINSEGISDLIIAGDLFDKDGEDSAYEHFRNCCRTYPAIKFHVIPGNHDPEKSLRDIQEDNLFKYLELTLIDFDGVSFLFIPYQEDISMDQELLKKKEEIGDNPWCFVGHGDFIDGPREINPHEKGVYMPLKREDIQVPGLCRVFLGHIHKPTNLEKPIAGMVTYPGSPQGLDISETGKRRFIIYDTKTDEISERKVNCTHYFLDETIFVFPSVKEKDLLEMEFKNRTEKSAISKENLSTKTYIRLKVKGFTFDKESLVRSFCSFIEKESINLYEKKVPDFDELFTATDQTKEKLAEKVLEKINCCEWNFGDEEPSLEDVKMAAMRLIYKE